LAPRSLRVRGSIRPVYTPSWPSSILVPPFSFSMLLGPTAFLWTFLRRRAIVPSPFSPVSLTKASPPPCRGLVLCLSAFFFSCGSPLLVPFLLFISFILRCFFFEREVRTPAAPAPSVLAILQTSPAASLVTRPFFF